MRKITVSIMAVMALTGACMVSFAANNSPAYQVWAHRSAPYSGVSPLFVLFYVWAGD